MSYSHRVVCQSPGEHREGWPLGDDVEEGYRLIEQTSGCNYGLADCQGEELADLVCF